jgi:hypothetical protein
MTTLSGKKIEKSCFAVSGFLGRKTWHPDDSYSPENYEAVPLVDGYFEHKGRQYVVQASIIIA